MLSSGIVKFIGFKCACLEYKLLRKFRQSGIVFVLVGSNCEGRVLLDGFIGMAILRLLYWPVSVRLEISNNCPSLGLRCLAWPNWNRLFV